MPYTDTTNKDASAFADIEAGYKSNWTQSIITPTVDVMRVCSSYGKCVV